MQIKLYLGGNVYINISEVTLYNSGKRKVFSMKVMGYFKTHWKKVKINFCPTHKNKIQVNYSFKAKAKQTS